MAPFHRFPPASGSLRSSPHVLFLFNAFSLLKTVYTLSCNHRVVKEKFSAVAGIISGWLRELFSAGYGNNFRLAAGIIFGWPREKFSAGCGIFTDWLSADRKICPASCPAAGQIYSIVEEFLPKATHIPSLFHAKENMGESNRCLISMSAQGEKGSDGNQTVIFSFPLFNKFSGNRGSGSPATSFSYTSSNPPVPCHNSGSQRQHRSTRSRR